MFKLKENEKVVLTLHRHWWVVAGQMTFISILLLVAVILLPIATSFVPEKFLMLTIFAIIIYILIVLLMAFIIWVDYYLDMWIVTTDRIIDINQQGLFRREISEFMLYKVQDVTIEIPNFIATVFGFGNIAVQTAGEKSFVAKDIPKVSEAKDIILEYAHKKNEKSGSESL